MEISLLGPIVVRGDDGHLIALRPIERRLLSRLALGRHRPVDDDALMSALWSRPPATARKTLHGHVLRLRRSIGDARVQRTTTGYVLCDAALDLDAVEETIAASTRAAQDGRLGDAHDLLVEAETMFRASPFPELDDCDDVAILAERARWYELGRSAIEDRIGIALRLGRDMRVLAELEGLVAADPTRERCWWLLASVHQRRGHRAEALDVLSRARRALALNLGVGLGPMLNELERELLTDDTAPTRSDDGRTAADDAALPAGYESPIIDPPFVGRRRELQALASAIRTVERTSVQVIVGEPGIGKSRLIAEVARGARGDGTTVVFGQAVDDYATGFHALSAALSGVAAARPRLAATISALVSLLDGRSVLGGHPEQVRADLFERIAGVFEASAADGPMLVVLEDLHWASNASIGAIAHVVRRNRHVPLLFAVTARSSDPSTADLLDELRDLDAVHLTSLSGLDIDDVRELITTAPSGESTHDIDVAEAIHARAGGNPFMLNEIIQQAATTTNAAAISQAVPDMVRTSLVGRARHALGTNTEILDLAALIGIDIDPGLISRTLGADPADVFEALDTAVRAQLVVDRNEPGEPYAFRHSIVRDAIAAAVTPGARTIAHRRIAEALRHDIVELGVDRSTLNAVSRYARHLLASDLTRDRTEGCHIACHVGERTLIAHDYDGASRWFTAGVSVLDDLPDNPELRVRLKLGHATAATLDGDQATARRCAADAWRVATRTLDRTSAAAAAMLYAGEPELNSVGDEPGITMLAAALDTLESTSSEGIKLAARLGSALSYTRHADAERLAVQAIENARHTGSTSDLTYSLRCRLRGWFDPLAYEERIAIAEELVQIGVRTADPITESWGWRWRTILLMERGDIAAVERASEHLEALAERLHLPNHRFSVAIRLAATRTFQGRFDDAHILIGAAAVHAQRLDNQVTRGVTRVVVDTLAWWTGQPLPAPPSDDHATVHTITSAPARADFLDRIAANPESATEHDIDHLGVLCLTALAIRLEPRADIADALYPRARQLVDSIAVVTPGAAMYGSMHLYAGILAREAGHREPATEHLRTAVTINKRLGSKPCTALAMHELARTLPHGHEAQVIADQSAAIAEQTGIPWLSNSRVQQKRASAPDASTTGEPVPTR